MIQSLKRRAQERKLQRQMERDIQIQQAKRRYHQFIKLEEQRNARLTQLAIEAHGVGSYALRDKLIGIIAQTRTTVKQWKERMVYFEMMQEVEAQASACANIGEAFHAMAQSIMTHANPADLLRIQMDVQKSFLWADRLTEMTDQLVQVMDNQLENPQSSHQTDFDEELKRVVTGAESKHQGVDREIETLLREITDAQH